MGVVHSMQDEQVKRVSHALHECANSIQGINAKFDEVDMHWRRMQEFNNRVNTRVEVMLDSFKRMDDTFASRGGNILETMFVLTDELSHSLEGTVQALNRFDIRRDTMQFTKVIIPMALPLLVLLVELGVANAYLGILLASLPEVDEQFSRYLLINASFILLGLTLSLLWLGGYRVWLSFKMRSLEFSGQKAGETAKAAREQSFVDASLDEQRPSWDSTGTPPPAVQLTREKRMRLRHDLYFNEESEDVSSAMHASGSVPQPIDRQNSPTYSRDSEVVTEPKQPFRERSSSGSNPDVRKKSLAAALRRHRRASHPVVGEPQRSEKSNLGERESSRFDSEGEKRESVPRLRSIVARRRQEEALLTETDKQRSTRRQTSPTSTPTRLEKRQQEASDTAVAEASGSRRPSAEAARGSSSSDVANAQPQNTTRESGMKPYFEGWNPFAAHQFSVQWKRKPAA